MPISVSFIDLIGELQVKRPKKGLFWPFLAKNRLFGLFLPFPASGAQTGLLVLVFFGFLGLFWGISPGFLEKRENIRYIILNPQKRGQKSSKNSEDPRKTSQNRTVSGQIRCYWEAKPHFRGPNRPAGARYGRCKRKSEIIKRVRDWDGVFRGVV